MFRRFTDASYRQRSPRPAWLGFLGPTIRAQVGEVIVVHLKNFASRNYSMHPHGVFYEKDTEGTVSHLDVHSRTVVWEGRIKSLLLHIPIVLDQRGVMAEQKVHVTFKKQQVAAHFHFLFQMKLFTHT